MESSAKYTLVGLFVVIATIIFVALLFWLTEIGGQRNTRFFTVYFRNHSLAGLQVDSAVTMKGIKVGTVTAYHISPESVEEVKVILRLGNDIPVKMDTAAILKRNLLTGLAFIDLIGSSDQSNLRVEIPEDEIYPVIPEGESELDKLADSIPAVLSQVNGMVSRANAVFSTENISSLERSLQNVEKLTAAFANKQEEIEEMIDKMSQTTSDISAASKSLRKFADGANGSLDSMSTEATTTLRSLNDTVKGLHEQAEIISSSVNAVSQVLSQEITNTSQSIAAAADSISRTAESFENPKAIIAGPAESTLGPGERGIRTQ